MARRKDESREDYNARLALVMKAKYIVRKAQAIEYLGGKCVDCGINQMLEFDHVDPSKKLFTIAHKLNGARWDVIKEELDKCVLRCVPCHGFVTAYQRIQHLDVLNI